MMEHIFSNIILCFTFFLLVDTSALSSKKLFLPVQEGMSHERLSRPVLRRKYVGLNHKVESASHLHLNRIGYNQYSDRYLDDKEFLSKGCRWSSITNHQTMLFYEAVSKCYQRKHWRKPLYVEVTCKDFAGNTNPSSIVSFMEKISESVGKMHLFGDSIMHQQKLVLNCMFQASGVQKYIPPRYVSLRGQDFESYLLSHHELFNYSFLSSDVLVANFGWHYQRNFSSVGKISLIKHATHFASFISNESSKFPRFIWREGTPQNYPTANGWWPYYFNTCKSQCECTKLTFQMRQGNGTHISFFPQYEENMIETSHPARLLHSIATDIMKSRGLRVSYVYDSLAAATLNLHGGRGVPYDCTHFGVDALIHMNMILLRNILDK